MAKKIIIIGGHGDGCVIASAIHDLRDAGHDLEAIGYINDHETAGTLIDELPVLGATDRVHDLFTHDDVYFVTALLKVKEAYTRSRKIDALGIPVNRFYTVIHPSATVSRRAVIGPGSFVGPHANVMPNVVMGRHCSLRASANIGHDCRIGHFCYVGPNATLSGRVTLGNGVHLGPNTSVLERVKLGDFSVVGMGSVVLKHVPEFSIAYGNPAIINAKPDTRGSESKNPT